MGQVRHRSATANRPAPLIPLRHNLGEFSEPVPIVDWPHIAAIRLAIEGWPS